eukprot:GDKH01008234.1.p1 GENE.GDKH01008234.1~~GDKH01008234.1.p1  ORF type:complete len:127 (+),score=20.64 GDKH01008234.1:96-476(+)
MTGYYRDSGLTLEMWLHEDGKADVEFANVSDQTHNLEHFGYSADVEVYSGTWKQEGGEVRLSITKGRTGSGCGDGPSCLKMGADKTCAMEWSHKDGALSHPGTKKPSPSPCTFVAAEMKWGKGPRY